MKKIFYSTIGLFLIACAVVKAPQGGPKDTQAPQVVSQFPENKSKNFAGSEITIEFDEYFQLKNFVKEVNATPYIDPNDINTIIRGKKLILNLPKLKANTTYRIDLGKSVCDITESNPLLNYPIIFSTGNEIDSLEIIGKILPKTSASLNKPFTVGLYQISDTISPIKDRPIYYTKTEKNTFTIDYLPKGEFQVYGFNDLNNNLLYDSLSENICFLNQAIKTTNDDTLKLNVFKEEIRKFKFNRPIIKENFVDVEFTKGLKNFNARNAKYLATKKTLRIYDTENTKQIRFSATDSLGQKIDTSFQITGNYLKKVDTTFTLQVVQAKNGQMPFKGIQFTAEHLFQLNNADSLFIKLNSDTISMNDSRIVAKFNEQKDTFSIYSLNETDTLKIECKKETFITYNGLMSKIYTQNYIKDVKASYGEINGSIETAYPNYYFILLDKTNNEITRIKNTKTFKINYLKPMQYQIKLLIDANNNDLYDTGDLQTKKQTEIIYEHPGILDVKPNWTVGNVLIKL
jgi:hypothetical protein